jgi:predicted HTH transcriptional regulator
VTPSSYGPSEDETCRQFVLPALDRAGWKEEQIRVQYPINKGRIRATARLHRQERPLIADYVPETPADSVPGGRPAEILALFAQQPELSAADVAQATGLGRAMVRRYLAQLVEEGRLSATAPPSSRKRTYRLPANSRLPAQ